MSENIVTEPHILIEDMRDGFTSLKEEATFWHRVPGIVKDQLNIDIKCVEDEDGWDRLFIFNSEQDKFRFILKYA